MSLQAITLGPPPSTATFWQAPPKPLAACQKILPTSGRLPGFLAAAEPGERRLAVALGTLAAISPRTGGNLPVGRHLTGGEKIALEHRQAHDPWPSGERGMGTPRERCGRPREAQG